MSFQLELPPYFRDVNEAYVFMTRTINRLNYALSFLDVPEATASAGIRAEDVNNKSIKISDKSTNTQYPTSKAVYDYAVPQGRKVNGKALTEDITLDAGDVGAVPDTRKVNGKRLNADIALIPGDLGEADYVTETGSNEDGWHWRKWASGKQELWGAMIPISAVASDWVPYGTALQYCTKAIQLPISFSGTDFSCRAAISRPATSGSAAVVWTIRHSAADKISLTIVAVNNYAGTAYNCDIYICGQAPAST